MVNLLNSTVKSWIEIPPDSDFSIYNIPFGIFSVGDERPRAATRVGDIVIDLSVLAEANYFEGLGLIDIEVFSESFLNDFIALGKPITSKIRQRLMELFSDSNHELKNKNDE